MSPNNEGETARKIITRNIGLHASSSFAGPNVRQSRISGNSQGFSGNNQSSTSGNSNSTITNSSTTNEPALDVVRELDRIVEQFRNKSLTKSRAIASITSKLGFDVTKEEPEKDAALDQYLSAIEAIERLAIETIRHGTNVPFESQGNLEETTTLSGSLSLNQPNEPIIENPMNPTTHQTQVHQATQKSIGEPPAKRRESSKRTCLGTPAKISLDNRENPVQLSPDESSSISEIISPQLKNGFRLHIQRREDFPHLNGKTSLKENL
jgi:hypothetical protein